MSQMDSHEAKLKYEKEGNKLLRQDKKVAEARHKEHIFMTVQKERNNASDFEHRLRGELAKQVATVDTARSELATGKEKVAQQEEELRGLEHKLGETTRAWGKTKEALCSISKELAETHDVRAATILC